MSLEQWRETGAWLTLREIARMTGRAPSSYLRVQLLSDPRIEVRRVFAPNAPKNVWRYEFRWIGEANDRYAP